MGLRFTVKSFISMVHFPASHYRMVFNEIPLYPEISHFPSVWNCKGHLSQQIYHEASYFPPFWGLRNEYVFGYNGKAQLHVPSGHLTKLWKMAIAGPFSSMIYLEKIGIFQPGMLEAWMGWTLAMDQWFVKGLLRITKPPMEPIDFHL